MPFKVCRQKPKKPAISKARVNPFVALYPCHSPISPLFVDPSSLLSRNLGKAVMGVQTVITPTGKPCVRIMRELAAWASHQAWYLTTERLLQFLNLYNTIVSSLLSFFHLHGTASRKPKNGVSVALPFLFLVLFHFVPFNSLGWDRSLDILYFY